MSSRKRKRYSKDLQCVYFPDDVQHAVQRAGREPSTLSSASSAKSWEKVGDSFLDMRATKNPKSSGRKLSAVKKLIQTPASVQTSGTHHTEDPVHIAWSSSDSGASGDETQEQNQSRAVALQRQRPRRPRRYMASIQSYRRDLSKLSCDQDDLPTIDTDSDLIESEEDVEKDSGQQISECESQLFDEEPKDLLLKPTNVAELEISGYVSDGENIGDTMILSKLESEIFPLQTGEGSTRSVSDWVRSAQAMLQTPQKPLDRVAKTPEDSAKKRRKLQSGGFAERLNRLQCRQRSSINFWRHQSMSDTSATTVDRPGVLVLRVLEVQEECSMQLVRCEHHEPPTQDPQCNNPVAKESARLLLLFTKETAAQLIPAPGDIIHIHPPWQRLSVEGFSCDIILNTHFSQKVSSASNPANISLSRSLLSVKRRMPYYLGKIFGLLEPWKTNTENNGKQVAVPDGLCHTRGVGVLNRHCLSLLEAIEALGQAGRVGQDVEVVVQRVFSIPVPDNSAVSIRKSRGPSGPTSAPLLSEKGKTRLCVLVQDSYGIFSVVQLHQLPCKDDLLCYCQRWQGKTCVLRAIKVVQRVTRERRTRLFSLIDSLWPPMMLLKDHGMTQSMSSESRPAGPAPSFCYLLSGQETSVEPTEGQTFSAMYFPPTGQTLRDILKIEMKTCRCTFVATVLYKRMQSSDVGHGEVWLVLTDPSLQEEHSEKPCRRTVALCVSTSCVLTSAVLEALHSSTAWCMLFRDAIKENGVLLCAEQSVVEMCPVESEDSFQSKTRSEQHSKSLTELQAKTLSQPVRLDPLSVQTTPNSLCTLTGTIVGVDENTAYSWPACNYCGSDNLQLFTEKPQSFHCTSCKSLVDKPERKIQLEVFLRSPNLNSCTLKVKLQKKTILSILNTTPLEGNEFPGYDVENVLGKEVGPLTVYVRVVTRKPAPWIGLEEICL